MYVLVTHNRVIFVLGAIHLQAKLLSVSKTFLLQPDRLCSFYSLSVYWPCDPCLPGPHLRCDKVLISEGVREQRCSILHVALKSHERRSTFGNVINFLSVFLDSAALPILLCGLAGTLRDDGVGSFSLQLLIFPFLHRREERLVLLQDCRECVCLEEASFHANDFPLWTVSTFEALGGHSTEAGCETNKAVIYEHYSALTVSSNVPVCVLVCVTVCECAM